MRIPGSFNEGWGDPFTDNFGVRRKPTGDGPLYPLSPFFNYYWTTANLGLANNDPVASWTDVNANKVLAQATPSARPLYVAASTSVQFNGTSHYLFTTDADVAQAPDSDANPSTQCAMLIVASGSRAVTKFSGGWGFSSDNNPLCVMAEGTNTIQGQHRNTAGTNRVTGTAASSGLAAMLITQNGDSFKCWQNGVQVGTTQTLGSTPYDFDRFALGCLLRATPAGFSALSVRSTAVAKGALAAALHNNPSSMFAASASEWGTPVP